MKHPTPKRRRSNRRNAANGHATQPPHPGKHHHNAGHEDRENPAQAPALLDPALQALLNQALEPRRQLVRKLLNQALAKQPLQTQPPPLEPLIGKQVQRAWLTPDHKVLFLLFQGPAGARPTLSVKVAPATAGPVAEILGGFAIQFYRSQEIPGADFRPLDALCTESPALRELEQGAYQLVGMLDGVLTFQSAAGFFGARFSPDGTIRLGKGKAETPVAT